MIEKRSHENLKIPSTPTGGALRSGLRARTTHLFVFISLPALYSPFLPLELHTVSSRRLSLLFSGNLFRVRKRRLDGESGLWPVVCVDPVFID